MTSKILHSFQSFIIFLNIILLGNSLNSEVDDLNLLIPLQPRAFIMTQRLDHFNKSDTRLWEQKYYISGENYMEDGPVFVLVSDYRAATSSVIRDNYQWMIWAKRFNALCIVVENRFFGFSQPTKDLSLESLKYFTLDQSLEDLVDFRAWIEYTYKLQNKKWVFFGGAFGGLLALNLRIKYPSLVDGVVASCAPVIFKVEDSESMDDAFKIIDKSSPTCVPAITSAIKQIEGLLEDGPSGWVNLSKKFQICGVLNGTNDKQVDDLFWYLADKIYAIVLFNEEYEDVTVDSMCEIMNNSLTGPEIDRLAQVLMLYFKSKNLECLVNLYEDMVEMAKDINLHSPFKATRMSWYITCTQIGYRFGSNDPKMPFHSKIPRSFIIEKCADMFGPQYDDYFITSSMNAINEKFGSGAINDSLTHVLFVSGSDDPAKSKQILNDINSDAKAIVIEGAPHCVDILPTTIYDSEELIKARSTIAHEIGNWINS